MTNCCKELPGVWAWDIDTPFPDIIEYLESCENNKSKNLKLAHIASNCYQYCNAYGLTRERKNVVKKLYENKQPINNQADLDMSIKHIAVFINDEYYVEEGILHSEYGPRYGLQYYNGTHGGLGKLLTKTELKKPDFVNEAGYEFEAKMCWETEASKYPGEATLNYIINPDNFDEKKFLAAFNELAQVKAMHTAELCFCLVKKRATFGYLVGVTFENGKGKTAKLLGPLSVRYLPEAKINKKFV